MAGACGSMCGASGIVICSCRCSSRSRAGAGDEQALHLEHTSLSNPCRSTALVPRWCVSTASSWMKPTLHQGREEQEGQVERQRQQGMEQQGAMGGRGCRMTGQASHSQHFHSLLSTYEAGAW
jgi:hypothetical protein